MPKPIKRKISRQNAGAEETVKTFMHVAIEKLEDNFKQVVIGTAALLALLIAVAVVFFVKSGAEERADRAFYDGYKAYHGLYDAKALTEIERFESALASFRRSYESEPSPQALLYLAYSQDKLGRGEDALESLNKLESKFPKEEYYVAMATYKTAIIQLKAGRTDDGLKTLDKLYTSRTGLYGDLALAESARALEGLGKEDEALDKYRAILSEFPESPFADEARLRLGENEPDVEGAGSSEN